MARSTLPALSIVHYFANLKGKRGRSSFRLTPKGKRGRSSFRKGKRGRSSFRLTPTPTFFVPFGSAGWQAARQGLSTRCVPGGHPRNTLLKRAASSFLFRILKGQLQELVRALALVFDSALLKSDPHYVKIAKFRENRLRSKTAFSLEKGDTGTVALVERAGKDYWGVNSSLGLKQANNCMQNAATPGVQLRCGDFAAAKNAGFRCALVF